MGLAMCVGDTQDAQDDAACASASGRNFFFCDVYGVEPSKECTFLLKGLIYRILVFSNAPPCFFLKFFGLLSGLFHICYFIINLLNCYMLNIVKDFIFHIFMPPVLLSPQVLWIILHPGDQSLNFLLQPWYKRSLLCYSLSYHWSC